MRRIKKWGKRLLKGLGIVLIPLVVYFLAALLLALISTRPKSDQCPEKQTIYISSNGIHLDIIFPSGLLPDTIAKVLPVPSDVNYLAFGWGDKGFYLQTPTWAELEARVALRAMFWKSETVMHVTHYRRTYDHWSPLALCPAQLERLQVYVWQSFREGEDGRIMKIPDAGYTRQDFFYEAIGSYSCFKTCNSWVNIGLKRAGVKTAVWSPFDFGVLHHLD